MRKKASITAEEAIEIAARVAAENDWPFFKPVRATWGLFNWKVVSNTGARGCNVYVTINRKTGKVVHKAFNPR